MAYWLMKVTAHSPYMHMTMPRTIHLQQAVSELYDCTSYVSLPLKIQLIIEYGGISMTLSFKMMDNKKV